MKSHVKLALAASAALLALVAYDQSIWWQEKPDYAFGWLVPVFCLYVLGQRRAAMEACLYGPTEYAGKTSPSRWPLFVAGLVILGALVLFAAGATYRAAAGPTHGGTFAITLGAITASAGLLFLAGMSGAGPAAHGRAWRFVALFAFPLLVWTISAPLLTWVEQTLSTVLRAHITVVVFGFYDLLGYAIEQRGNVLILPTGQVGVAEACSGIRSLTGCLFAGSFLAATQAHRTWQKLLLIAAASILAVIANLLRSIFLTGWSIAFGSGSIEGTVHDATGYAVLGITVVGLLALLPLFSPPRLGQAGKDPDPHKANSPAP